MLSVILSWDFWVVLAIPLVLARFAWLRKWHWIAVSLVLFSLFLLVAVIAPSFKKAHPISERNACIANLKQLDGAKAQWAFEKKPKASTVPQLSDLAPFLKGGLTPLCPAGGTYTLGAVNEPPRCSHAAKGHILPSATPAPHDGVGGQTK
ncbi:MAG: hypothetical protein ABMA26_16875 [Limisphaerales bacterium]